MTDTPRSRFRLPHWGWMLLATVLLAVAYVGLSVWLPWHREQPVIQMIKRWDGGVLTETIGPVWLRQLTSETRLKAFNVFERVVIVNLDRTAITDAEFLHLSECKNLRELSLDGTAVSNVSLSHFHGKSNLTRLYLNGTPVTDSGVAHLSEMTNLVVLDVGGTPTTDAGLSHLSGLTKLQFIVISNTSVTDSGLAHLTGLKNLIYIALDGTSVTDKGIEDVKASIPDCEIVH